MNKVIAKIILCFFALGYFGAVAGVVLFVDPAWLAFLVALAVIGVTSWILGTFVLVTLPIPKEGEEIYLAFCQYRDANNLPADHDSYRQFKDAYIRDKGKETSE